MKVGIIGLGFVGSAVKHAFEKAHVIVGYDKFKNIGQLEDMEICDLVFVCVPTPTEEGIQDLRPTHDVLSSLTALNFKGPVVIKSTVLPGTCDRLQEIYSTLTLVHNPEFLTEAKALADFENQLVVLLSSPSKSALILTRKAYREALPDALCETADNFKATEIAKYIHNCFLATKVAFMNEVYNYCQDVGACYEEAVAMAQSQGRIGASHLNVPGPDGKFGFGGSCFPKDTEALLSSKSADRLKILKAAVQSNKMQRVKCGGAL
jgi:nucleotide sugar dehydrogenase